MNKHINLSTSKYLTTAKLSYNAQDEQSQNYYKLNTAQ